MRKYLELWYPASMRFCSGSIVLALAFGGLSFAGPVLFSVTPVAAPSGYTIQFADSINNLGQVVGVATGPGNVMAVFMSSGGVGVIVPFISPPANYSPQSVFINDSGQIAGGDAGAGQAFYGNASGVSFLATPAADKNGGTPIGVFVDGLSNTGTFVGGTEGAKGPQAAIGNAGGITQLLFDGGFAINNMGQALVQSGNGSQTFIVTGGSSSPVSGLGSFSAVDSINNSDQIAGSFTNSTNSAFVVAGGSVTPIPHPASGFNITTAILNDQGIVVGNANNSGNFDGYMWDPVNGTRFLSSLVPQGWSIQSVEGINDAGQILAFGTFTTPGNTNAQGISGAVVLSQIATPEPATLPLAATALLALALLHKRRA